MAKRDVELDGKKFSISYEIINPTEKTNIVFLHGWGSNKEIMKVFKDNFKSFRHVYIDMPGFGKSTNEYVLTTQDYANIIKKFLSEINATPDIVIGHSFGGKVATLLNPNVLVLLASAGIVMPKPFDVKLKIAIFKTLNKLGFGVLRDLFVSKDAKGMQENMYQTFKNVVDEDFSDNFSNFKGKVLIFGGEEDSAVPKEAIKKQGELFNSEIIMLTGDHYFFFNSKDAKTNRAVIEKKILESIN